ncbi:MAG: heparinase II/III family protein [Spirochaetes bacterium]|nr:heparinase II/III family protein [Spirochaetota bacterium]
MLFRCITLCIIAGTLSAADAAVSFTNAAFTDADGNGTPDGWTYTPAPDGTTTRIEIVTVEGKRAVKITDDNPKVGVGFAQTVPVTPGKTYRERAVIMGGKVALYMNWQDKDKKKIIPEVSKIFEADRAFTPCEWEAKAPDNAAFCVVWAYSTSTAKTTVHLASLDFGEAVEAPGLDADTLATFGFENDAWAGGERSEKNVKQGKASLRWADMPKNTSVNTAKILHDWTGYNAISFRVYSEKNTRQDIALILDSRTDSAKFSYFAKNFTVDWTGWQEVTILFSDMGKSREPAGFQKIDKISLNASGWGITPNPDTVLYIDDIRLVKGAFGSVRSRKVLIPPPSREALMALVRKNHPRMLITDADVARIKKDLAGNETAKKSYTMLKSRADKALGEATSKYETPDGLRLLTTSRRVLGRAYTLGMMYLLDGDAKYKERLWAELEEAGKFKDWNPRHYLDTAEMMHAFGVAYDWLYNAWSDDEKKFIRNAIVNLGLTNSAAAYRGKGPSVWWVNGNNNWNFVCNGGSTVAALAVFEDEPDLAVDIITNAFASFQAVMEEFEPDGAWYEGPGYWHYSIKYLIPMIGSYESALGTNFGVLDTFGGFCKTGDFPVYTTGPSGYSFNFADAGAGKTGSFPELFWFAKKFKNPLYHLFEKARISGAAEELMYFDASLEGRTPASVSPDKYFSKTEVALLCGSWADTNALYIGLKSGANGVNHFHYDLGSFVLDSGGQRFFEDLGSEWMTYISYQHSYKHHEFYRIRPEGHNTLVIAPSADAGQLKKAVTKISVFESLPQSAQASVDLTEAYRPQAKKVIRTASLIDGRKAIEVADVIEAAEPATVWWFAHTKAAVTITPDGKRAVLTRPGAALTAEIRSPFDARFSVMNAVPLATSPDPTNQNKNAGMRKLAIALSNVSAVTLVVRFAPQATEPLKAAVLGDDFKPMLDKAVKIEAETFVAEEGGTVKIVDKLGNSGKSFNLWDNDGHSVTWKYSVPEDGTYGIQIRYCTAEEAVRRAVIVDGKTVKDGAAFVFLSTGGWSSSKDDWQDAWFAGNGGLRIPLIKGDHTITLINKGGGGMNVDWIKIVPLK